MRPSSFSTDEFAKAVHAMQPIALDLEDRMPDAGHAHRQASSCNGSKYGPVCVSGREYSCKFEQQFDKIRKCYDMVVAYEKRMNIQYRWVARIRPDIMLQGNPQLHFCSNSHDGSRVETYRNSRTYGDHFARLTRSDAHIYFSAVRAANHCVPLQELQRGCHLKIQHGDKVMPECLLTHHMMLHRLSLMDHSKQIHVRGGLLRSDRTVRNDVDAWW